MEHPRPEPGSAISNPSPPEVVAIEAALPPLADDLRLALESLAAEFEAMPRIEVTPAEPAGHTAESTMEDALYGVAPPPGVEPAGIRRERLRVALARWLALRAAGVMAMGVPDLSERARLADELGRLLGGADTPNLDEAEAERQVLAGVPDLLARDSFPQRVEQAATLAVRHVLLGGPHPGEADRTPRPGDVASMGRRLVAYLLDLAVLACLSFVAGTLVYSLGGTLGERETQLFGYLMAAVGGLVNVQLIATTGTTLGKLTMRIGVVRAADGSTPDLELAFRREFVGRFMNSVLFGIGSIVGAFDKLRQTWGDRWAGTVVIRLREPVAWRKWAVISTVTASAVTLFYFPAASHLGDLDTELAALMEEEGVTVISLTDSLVQLVTRPVESPEAMQADIQAILALAPSAHERARAMHEKSSEYLRETRRLTPWNAGAAAQIDSLFMLAARCAASAETFAIHTSKVPALDSVSASAARETTRRLQRAAQYASSDLLADRQIMVILGERLSPEESGVE